MSLQNHKVSFWSDGKLCSSVPIEGLCLYSVDWCDGTYELPSWAKGGEP
jgi:hypothetical protein